MGITRMGMKIPGSFLKLVTIKHIDHITKGIAERINFHILTLNCKRHFVTERNAYEIFTLGKLRNLLI